MERSTLLLCYLGLYLYTITQVSAEQHFITPPVDTTVIQGQAAILNCVVEDLAGDLQWVKDGYGMGYDRDLPGYPHYVVTGNQELGENNLMIRSTSLADDADFSCQVGPRGAHPPIHAAAHLHIQVPPKVPEVVGHPNGSLVEVPYEQKSINLTCVCKDGKPAATLKWYKDGVEVTENKWDSVQESDEKLKTAESTIEIFPGRFDNGALFTCNASNPASEGIVLQTIVQLSVMHPPQPPEITGYKPGQVVTTGETLHLRCIAKGGNPPPRVHWYKNGKELDLSYKTGDGVAENDLYMTVQPNDNNAVYKCEAKNRVTATPMTTEVKLIVEFGPEKMTITGDPHAKVGETITLMCASDISNPAAKITWSVQGRTITNDVQEVAASPEGGFTTTSNITVTLTTKHTDNILYTCNGVNEKLAKMATDSISLSIMYPPDPPVISGYVDGQEVEAESVLPLVCTAQGGNPLAKVIWWKGDKEIESITHTYQRIVSTRITITLFREDNLAEYRCSASNPATPKPLNDTVVLTVNYPPTKLNITTRPVKPKAGQPLTVICSSDASNPESQLTWWKDGIQVKGMPIRHETTDAEYGGKATRSELDVTATSADDAQIYECRAMNKLLEKAVNDAIKLDVTYKPVFAATAPATLSIVEFQSGLLDLTATANPSGVTYIWYKGSEKLTHESKAKRDVSIPHFIIDGPVLNITNVTRADADVYTIEAANSEGATNFSVKLDVQYPAEISKVTESVNVDHNTIGILECHFKGNPLPGAVKWSRAGYNMSRPDIETSGGMSKLVVHNVTKEDSGSFVCEVTNGIKDVTVTAEASLVVKYAPEIDRAPRYSRAAARNMETGSLLCKAEGAPAVKFKWFRNNKEIDVTGVRYHEETTKDNIVQYTSTLQVFNVTKEDYGKYVCKAHNELGTDQHSIDLADTSEPQAPYDVHIKASTHNSVTLTWTPGFNGGAPQSFHIRYRRVGAEGYKTEEVMPKNATVYVVTGLSRGTEYEFSVKGVNSFGSSPYQEALTGRTAVSPLVQDDNVPLIIILTVSIFGMLLLGLNILLILFFYRRRRKKMEKDQSEGASNANTVEMFSAPTITEDSKSYSTYDRSLDDFHDDYRVYDPEDELKRFLPPPNYSFYRPPSSNLYGPPPHVGSAPHLGPAPYGPSPAFDGQRSLGPQQPWDNRKYDTYGSMPRVPPGSPPDDREEYANQLRALTKGINPASTLPRDHHRAPRADQGPPSMPPPSRPPPPLPPTRSSSNLTEPPPRSMPPLPTRNYDREEMPPAGGTTPRYAPPPAFQTPGSRPTSRPPSRPQSQHYDYEAPSPLYQGTPLQRQATPPHRQATPTHYHVPSALSQSHSQLRASTQGASPRPPSVDAPRPPTSEMRGQLV